MGGGSWHGRAFIHDFVRPHACVCAKATGQGPRDAIVVSQIRAAILSAGQPADAFQIRAAKSFQVFLLSTPMSFNIVTPTSKSMRQAFSFGRR